MLENKINLKPYLDVGLTVIPRALTLGDRLQGSDTCGCYDRYFWHYKILDFANARFQEIAWLLAVVYSNKLCDSPYYQNINVKKWALSAIQFWCQIQKSDGSVDEVYPFEHSFVSTAFSTFATTEAALILEDSSFNTSFEKSANWLASHNNMRVANQMAGAAAALYNTYLLTNNDKYRIAAKDKIKKLSTLQHNDGYFIEYGGFDMGYLSIGLSYLARYYEKSSDPQTGEMIKKAITFAKHKVSDDGTYDYSKTSRNTQYIYPYGFLHEEELSVINKHTNGLNQNRVVSPLTMDDRFFAPLTVDYLTTYIKGNAQ